MTIVSYVSISRADLLLLRFIIALVREHTFTSQVVISQLCRTDAVTDQTIRRDLSGIIPDLVSCIRIRI